MSKIRYQPGDVLIIKLYDITSDDGWLPDVQAQNYPLAEIAVVGCFINEDKKVIRLSSFVADDGAKDIRVLPKVLIMSIKKLKREK